jgi:hypothetical protein
MGSNPPAVIIVQKFLSENICITMGSNPPAVIIVQKFLSENICMPVKADGVVIDADSIPINIGA